MCWRGTKKKSHSIHNQISGGASVLVWLFKLPLVHLVVVMLRASSRLWAHREESFDSSASSVSCVDKWTFFGGGRGGYQDKKFPPQELMRCWNFRSKRQTTKRSFEPKLNPPKKTPPLKSSKWFHFLTSFSSRCVRPGALSNKISIPGLSYRTFQWLYRSTLQSSTITRSLLIALHRIAQIRRVASTSGARLRVFHSCWCISTERHYYDRIFHLIWNTEHFFDALHSSERHC